MYKIHGVQDDSPEYQAAEEFRDLALGANDALRSNKSTVLEIFPSIQCFGQRNQDVDLLVFYADYRDSKLLYTAAGKEIHSFCAVIELKGHSPSNVKFEGAHCTVKYRDKWHDVTSQSEGQKYSVREYIIKNSLSKTSPWIENLIWFSRVPSSLLPKNQSNLVGCDASWDCILEKIALLSSKNGPVKCFTIRPYLQNTLNVFAKEIVPSKIDRKRLEAITKKILDSDTQKYAERLGDQLLIFRGRGGTGKTVRLLRVAYQAYEEMGFRVVLLTYNKALVADLRRLLALLETKDAIGQRSISIKTIHSFMHEWLVALDVIKNTQADFLANYEVHKNTALEYIRSGLVSSTDIENSRIKHSRGLSWDLLLIDESQDWPENERDLIYELYGYKSVIIADGVDQFVRGVEKTDWRESLDKKQTQIVPLKQSLRLKASLCRTVGHFASKIQYQNWNLVPLDESYGGKVVIVTGNPLSESFHRKLVATSTSDGNRPIDMLFCVPPTWVEDLGNGRESRVGRQYTEWGLKVWDAVNPELRDEFPTSLDEFRIVQYESCRGLEGWVVVNFALDEFFDYKRKNAAISDVERCDIFFDSEESKLEYAKKWVMIPLTRAIDTLVIHVSDVDSYIGKVVIDLYNTYPESIELFEF